MASDPQIAAMNHLEHLSLAIGPRPLGSRSNLAAEEYIADVLGGAGFEVARQPFACPLWEARETGLELEGQGLARHHAGRHLATPNAFSPPCDVRAPTVAVGTVAELEQADLADRIGLLYGELTKGTGIGARSAVYYPDTHQRIIAMLEEKRPPALITIQGRIGSLERLLRDPEFVIPSATVPAEVGRTLLEREGEPLRLLIESHSSPSEFSNVVATRPGSGTGRIALLAHYDTIHNSPGAVDNGSGVAVLLALATHFSQMELEVGLEWILVNGEENGGLGDAAYVRHKGDTLDQILALVNIDGVGERVGANSVTVMGASQPLEDRIRDLHRRYRGIIWAEPWYESDHSAFLWRGVPAVPFSSVGVTNLQHGPTDTIDWISPANLGQVADFAARVVESLQDSTAEWCREKRSE